MKKCFTPKNFSAPRLALIEYCDRVLTEYAAEGYDVTLRQLYYQLVAADVIPNSQSEYKRLGEIVNDARLAGLIDWEHIVDRTRNLLGLAHWDNPAEIMDSVCDSYRIDKWATQTYRPEVWIEKDALAGVFERVCDELDVPYFSCRGYTSQSEMFAAARRMMRYRDDGQRPYILHFGDHDPSGIDMSRDIQDRLEIFGVPVTFERLALNMDQVKRHKPPPNPAKLTDSRCHGYIAEYGSKSWELDALRPEVLAGLVRDAITEIIDEEPWDEAEARETQERTALDKIRDNFPKVQKYVAKLK
jgi:hypothetical protein